METLKTFLEQQPLLSMFLVIALGYAIGAVNIRSFNLGIGAVLFVGPPPSCASTSQTCCSSRNLRPPREPAWNSGKSRCAIRRCPASLRRAAAERGVPWSSRSSGTRRRARRRSRSVLPIPGRSSPCISRRSAARSSRRNTRSSAPPSGSASGSRSRSGWGPGSGGEGFILQRLTGDGWAFLHAGGTILERDLAPGETMRVDTGCIVGFTSSVDYDIEMVGGIKSALFGGEGLFFATLKGPGKIWLQSLPLSRMAMRIYAAAPQGGGRRVGEGSVLGGLGGLLDGDNR